MTTMAPSKSKIRGYSTDDASSVGSDGDFEVRLESSMKEMDRRSAALAPILEHAKSEGSLCMMNPDTGKWSCAAYKREKLQNEMDTAQANGVSKNSIILSTLQEMNINCYLVPYNTVDVLTELRAIVDTVARENLRESDDPAIQRCCLYQDAEGRLFNLVVTEDSLGPATQWASLMQSFSGTQALVAFTVLTRSFSCAFQDNLGRLSPAYLSLILGLVFTEELSLSWVNSSMLVRRIPSISAHTLTTNIGSDWLRKIMVLVLALSGAASGSVQMYLALAGISLACIILMVNVGSRSWHNMKVKPMPYSGHMAQLFGYITAAIFGLIFPYIGLREVQSGGKRALESVIMSAITVAIVFVLSDFDQVQRILVVGSETCPQDEVNIVVGGWWALSLLASLYMVLRVEPSQVFSDGEESILVPAQESVVGYRVPNLPDFAIDPVLVKPGNRFLSIEVELVVGTIMAFAVGGGIIYLAFTGVDDQLTGNASTVNSLFGI